MRKIQAKAFMKFYLRPHYIIRQFLQDGPYLLKTIFGVIKTALSKTPKNTDYNKKELKNMDQRLYELEEKMTSIDTKLSQVVDAILGNPLTKSGGFIKDIEIMKEKIQELENKIQFQEEFKKKITWTVAIVVTVALILEYFVNIYSSIT